ncbi:MAG: CHRD domain-containing protein [Chloroflexi bacterium]|nr:CHRD domain-containing protein [Chloroflexota bacterium]
MQLQAAPDFKATLAGANEVPPVATQATGEATFFLSQDGMSLTFKLTAANIENITQSHIHTAATGVNGPVVAWLYPSAPPAVLIPGAFNGVLSEGTLTADSLRGVLAGRPLAELIAAIRVGNAYVNVHTSQRPGGEMRGQIQ